MTKANGYGNPFFITPPPGLMPARVRPAAPEPEAVAEVKKQIGLPPGVAASATHRLLAGPVPTPRAGRGRSVVVVVLEQRRPHGRRRRRHAGCPRPWPWPPGCPLADGRWTAGASIRGTLIGDWDTDTQRGGFDPGIEGDGLAECVAVEFDFLGPGEARGEF